MDKKTAIILAGASGGAVGGGSMPSPVDIFGSDLVAWWDFADGATVTQSSGKIDSVTDKSGNGRTLSGTTTTRPAYSSTGFHNSVGAAVFDGVDDILQTASFDPAFGNECAVFVHGVFHQDAEASGAATLNKRMVSYTTDTDGVDYSGGSGILLYVTDGLSLNAMTDVTKRGRSDTIPYYGPQPLMADQHCRMLSVFDGANHTLYVENRAGTPVACTTTFGGPGKISVGNAIADSSGAWKGPITEVVITKRAPTPTERKQMMQWQTRHWTNLVYCYGDSIVHAGPTAADGGGYIYQAIPSLGSDYYIVNSAIGGTSFDGTPTDDPDYGLTFVGGRLDDAIAQIPNSKFGQKYILYFNYSNNANTLDTIFPPNGAGTTTADYTGDFGTKAGLALAAGFDACVTGTILSRADGQANDPVRNEINGIFTGAGWAAGHNFASIADLASDAVMGVDDAPDVHPDKFNGSVHPDYDGNTLLAPHFVTGIQAAAA